MVHEELRKVEERIDRKRNEACVYSLGQWVWVYRQTAYTGVKMQIMWMGPYCILRREGEDSCVVEVGPRRELQVHIDQMKVAYTSNLRKFLHQMAVERFHLIDSPVRIQFPQNLADRTTSHFGLPISLGPISL